MVSSGTGKYADEIKEEPGSATVPNGLGIKNQIPLYTQPSQRGLLNEKNNKNILPDIIKWFPNRREYMKFGRVPSAKFRQFAEGRDEISRAVPSSEQYPRRHFHVPFIEKINWASLLEMAKVWIRNPMNMALFVWILCVAISGAILFLVMTGMLNAVLPSKTQRNAWFEVNNQILNALFTLMCLYQHPKRFYHLVLLCRWGPQDVLKLRKIYCKNGTYKPNEWVHMMVVVLLLHLNCFAQYALCGLNLGYPRSRRPAIGVAICCSVAICAPAFACVYNIVSPLGRDYEMEIDQEAQHQVTPADESISSRRPRLKSFEKKYSFMSREDQRVAEANPEWVGGLFDFWDDLSLAYLSLFCSCCVFGWNMDRLGFGNMYVHIATFLLFCLAPFFIFNLAAINIDNEGVREGLGIAGILLCVFGMLYGGFWRIRMRKRFNLPGYKFCFGNPAVTDCFQWLCCCWCSLAQEVRTADYYDVVEDKFCLKQTFEDSQPRPTLSPLPHEEGSPLFRSSPSSPFTGNRSSPSHFKMESSSTPRRSPGGISPERRLPVVVEESSLKGEDGTMKAPSFSFIRRDDLGS